MPLSSSAPSESAERRPLLITRLCPLCSRDNADEPVLDIAPPEWRMKTCPACDMTYLEVAPDISEMFETFAWEKQRLVENARRHAGLGAGALKARKAWRKFRPLPRKTPAELLDRYAPPGAVVDVGCGGGEHLVKLGPQFSPVGIEISVGLAEEARQRLANRDVIIVNADALSGLKQIEAGSLTGVIMRSFLEHDVTPLPILEQCARVLAPGGVVIIKVPNFASLNARLRGANWCGLRFPDHVNYFTPDTLTRAVKQVGLTIRAFGPTYRLPTSDNMWMVAERPVA
jgi:SAM-dependent methyltransferase